MSGGKPPFDSHSDNAVAYSRTRSGSRSRFPSTRHGLTRKFNCGLDVYLTINATADGEPGEVFVKLGKQGSTVSGLIQAWVVTISAPLQRGVP